MGWTDKTPRKLDFALEWLIDHPGAVGIPDRDLEQKVWMSQYRKVGYRTWNKAKKLLATQGGFPDTEVAA